MKPALLVTARSEWDYDEMRSVVVIDVEPLLRQSFKCKAMTQFEVDRARRQIGESGWLQQLMEETFEPEPAADDS